MKINGLREQKYTSSPKPPSPDIYSEVPLIPSGIRPDPWGLGTTAIALLFAVPVLVVFGYLTVPAGEVWAHLADTVLTDYLLNSAGLLLGVSIGALSMGVTMAWLTSMCRFPGRRLFEWAALLPLAMPAYIIAYTYSGMLDFAGPVQTGLRDTFGWGHGEYWFPEIHSLWGAATMLSLVLYPYVYLLTRAALLEQSVAVLEVSRTLGAGPWRTLFKVALPLARPAIVTGLSLALMETLADYGTVKHFGVDTFTTGIFRTWFGLGENAAAAQLSAMLLGFVLLLVWLERRSRRQARYHRSGHAERPPDRIVLRGWRAATATVLCLLPVLFGFLLPAGQLTVWAMETAADMVGPDFITLTVNSLLLASGTALLALLFALFMAYGRRLRPGPWTAFSLRLASMGYAVPGTVIAVGVMLPFAWLDNALDGWLRANFGISSGLLFSGTLFILIFAYLVRFLAVSIHTVEAGLGKIRPGMDDAARSLGHGPLQVLGRVHIPLMRRTLLTCVLLVFVDVLKELPATLILRPFNFNTLAVRTFELASDERLADSSTAALTIVAAGLIPVVLLTRAIVKK